MDLLADTPFMLTLGALALVDGLSVGTLLIPVFLLLSPGRVRAGRVLLYLLAITVFYLLVGLLFLWGLVNVVEIASDWFSSTPGAITRLVIGAAMLIGSFLLPQSKQDSSSESSDAAPPASAGIVGASAASAAATASRPAQSRLIRWRDQLLDPRTRPIVVIGVAILAGLAEVATMLPYIAAMTMLADSGAPASVNVLALVGYCVLMIALALVLLVMRIVAAPLIEKPLRRLAGWLSRSGAETTAWIVGIVGFLIARAAAAELGLFDIVSDFTQSIDG